MVKESGALKRTFYQNREKGEIMALKEQWEVYRGQGRQTKETVALKNVFQMLSEMGGKETVA
jgi:hypothetical protein